MMNLAVSDRKMTPLSPFGLEVAAGEPGTDLGAIGVSDLRAWVREHGFVLLRGIAPPEGEALPRFAGTLGEILTWEFGAVNELRTRSEAKNYLYTDHAVPFHWDGAFAGRIPHYIVFHCEDAPPPGAGGETLFCDTVRLLERAGPEQREAWSRVSITYSTEKLAHYGGSFTSPLLATDPETGRGIVRFAEPVDDLNPVRLQIDGIPAEAQPRFLQEMYALLRDPALCYAHPWRPGDVLIADNFTLLHGRNAFRNPERRSLRRVNVL
jgi:alpha-ketoglutarate-dependent taurine dioxygenase